MAQVSKEKWLQQWGSASMDSLRAGAKEYGHELQAKNKAEALDEAYALYAGSLKPTGASPPAPVAAPLGPLQYEGRAKIQGSSYCRAGYVLTRSWAALEPTPSAGQLAILAADKFAQVRIKG